MCSNIDGRPPSELVKVEGRVKSCAFVNVDAPSAAMKGCVFRVFSRPPKRSFPLFACLQTQLFSLNPTLSSALSRNS
eukprot:2805966-Rhodomonas_salina.1